MTIGEMKENNDVRHIGVLTTGFGDKLVYRLGDKVWTFSRKDILNNSKEMERVK
jgi:hypothetical protein